MPRRVTSSTVPIDTNPESREGDTAVNLNHDKQARKPRYLQRPIMQRELLTSRVL